MPRRAVVVLLLALGLTGCSTGDGDLSPSGPYQAVEFAGVGGEPQEARQYGPADAAVGVVLSHMARAGDGPDDWAATAEALAERGHRVVTYQRSRPRYQVGQGIAGAVEYLRESGAEKVVVAGASLGATASLRVALEPAPATDAVVWVAGALRSGGMAFDQATVAGLSCPVLLITADQDGYGGTEATQQLHSWLPGSRLLLLPSTSHGTDLLADGAPVAEQFETAVLDFVDQVAAASPTPC